MGLLDRFGDIAGSLLGNQQAQGSPLLKAVAQMLSSNSTGGLSGLVQNFQNNGLGEIVSSWIGTGQNRAVSIQQIQSVLGSETIQRLASKVGISTNEVGNQLTQLLPNLVDKLTPDGQMPQKGALEQVLSVLQSKLK